MERRRGTAGCGYASWSSGEERGGELFVEAEEMFHAFAVGVEGLLAVALLHGAIEFGVGLGERGGHGERVVKIGQRGKAARREVRRARGEDGERLFPYALFWHHVRIRPEKTLAVEVDHVVGVFGDPNFGFPRDL